MRIYAHIRPSPSIARLNTTLSAYIFASTVSISVSAVSNRVLIFPPNCTAIAIHTTAIDTRIITYSVIPCPRWFFVSLFIIVFLSMEKMEVPRIDYETLVSAPTNYFF